MGYKLIHIICGKLCGKAGVKVRGKQREKAGTIPAQNADKWTNGSFPHIPGVIPKVIHTVFHAIYQMFVPISTVPTITTTLINNI
jgi:hypothetical protein